MPEANRIGTPVVPVGGALDAPAIVAVFRGAWTAFSASLARGRASRRNRPSALRLLGQLVWARVAEGTPRDARRLVWRAARRPFTTRGWLRTLDGLRLQTGAPAIPFGLARKPGRAFLHRALGYSQKVRLLETHYARLLATLGSRLTGRILAGEQLVLAEFSGKSSTVYRLRLSRNEACRREGELIVVLTTASSDRPLASLSLVAGAYADAIAPTLWIGGAQGCRGTDSRELTVAVTRDLWGLRPKDMLIHAARGLAPVFGVRQLKAISDAGHVIPRARAGAVGRQADYDAYWRELGGVPDHEGFFVLPMARPRRAEGDVPSAKRKAWLARCALIEAIHAGVRGLAGWSHGV